MPHDAFSLICFIWVAIAVIYGSIAVLFIIARWIVRNLSRTLAPRGSSVGPHSD